MSMGQTVALTAKGWKLDIKCGLMKRDAAYKTVLFSWKKLFCGRRKMQKQT